MHFLYLFTLYQTYSFSFPFLQYYYNTFSLLLKGINLQFCFPAILFLLSKSFPLLLALFNISTTFLYSKTMWHYLQFSCLSEAPIRKVVCSYLIRLNWHDWIVTSINFRKIGSMHRRVLQVELKQLNESAN